MARAHLRGDRRWGGGGGGCLDRSSKVPDKCSWLSQKTPNAGIMWQLLLCQINEHSTSYGTWRMEGASKGKEGKRVEGGWGGGGTSPERPVKGSREVFVALIEAVDGAHEDVQRGIGRRILCTQCLPHHLLLTPTACLFTQAPETHQPAQNNLCIRCWNPYPDGVPDYVRMPAIRHYNHDEVFTPAAQFFAQAPAMRQKSDSRKVCIPKSLHRRLEALGPSDPGRNSAACDWWL